MTTSGDVLIWTVTGLAAGAALAPTTHALTHQPIPRHLLLSVAPALTAALFAILAWRTPHHTELLAYSALAALAVPLAITDAREQRLPLPLLHAAYLIVITTLTGSALLNGDLTTALRALTGMVASLLIYVTLALASPGSLGAGDVRLAGLTGWTLAWTSWNTLLLGTIVFLVTTLPLLLLTARRPRRPAQVPAGPAMLLGVFAALLS